MEEYEITSVAFDITDDSWETDLKEMMDGGGWRYVESFRDAVIGNGKRVAILQREKNATQAQVVTLQEKIILLEKELNALRPSLDVKVLKELQDQFQDATQAVARLQQENATIRKVNEEQASLVRDLVNKPIEMFLKCPQCGMPHVDRDEWTTKPHRTHLCEFCKCEWRPCNLYTVGIKSLPKMADTARVGDLVTGGIMTFNPVTGTISDGTKVRA